MLKRTALVLGDMLSTERPGRLRIFHDDTLDNGFSTTAAASARFDGKSLSEVEDISPPRR